MSKKKVILALKPYLETVKQRCLKLTHEELCNVVSLIAQETAPDERSAFVDKILSLSQKKELPVHVDIEQELIERIIALKAEIAGRHEAIENGEYYDDNEDWDSYDDEPDSLSDEQKEELENLFGEVDHLFLSGELLIAKKAYEVLLGMFGLDSEEEDEDEEEVEFIYTLSDYNLSINWRETRARYCRCVYETAEPAERIPQMIHAMEMYQEIYKSSYNTSYEPENWDYPLLQDVYDTRTEELSDWEAFLRGLIQALKNKTYSRAYILYLEAVNWIDGLDGVVQEVRKQASCLGYLFWLDRLIKNNSWQDVCTIAQEALEKIPSDSLRPQVAKVLTEAAQKTDNTVLILRSYRERFYSSVDDLHLGLLLAEAIRQNIRNEELENILIFLESQKEQTGLKVKVLLMLGRVDETIRLMVDKAEPLGWSYGSKGVGVFFGGILAALIHSNPDGTAIHELLKRYIKGRYSYYSSDSDLTDSERVIYDEIVNGLKNISIDDSQKKRWFNIVRKLGGNRIDGIVSNQRRKSYDKAAELLAALMESYHLNDQSSDASILLNTYRNDKYKRHSAFRREVDSILKRSKALKTLKY